MRKGVNCIFEEKEKEKRKTSGRKGAGLKSSTIFEN
jgi:hypothetical protein